MLSFRDLVQAFRSLGLSPRQPVLVHASLSSFGEEIRGGADTLLGALLAVSGRVMTPAFTYRTMIIPEAGPENNGLTYGSGKDLNQMAEFFFPDMPADPLMGILAETVRRHPQAKRSMHPILSFAGIGLEEVLAAQTLAEPLAPIGGLAKMDGEVVLIGVNHTVNTSIHYAEALAGRQGFIRWALTPRGVWECPGFPGCSDGFDAAAPLLEDLTRRASIARAEVQVIPLAPMLERLREVILQDPLALLCQRETCERCDAYRRLAVE